MASAAEAPPFPARKGLAGPIVAARRGMAA